MTSLKDQIKMVVQGDVDDDPATLLKYSHDASLFEIKPQVVVYPKNANDIKALVVWVNQNKKDDPTLSVTVRAAGTCMSGGSINNSIILDVSRYMVGIKEVKNETLFTRFGHPVSGSATVLPGTFYRDFDKETKAHGMIMPTYSASRDLCAVGGMIGNNAGGEKSIHYGKTEDWIKQLKVIFHDGKEYTVLPLSKVQLEAKIAEGTEESKLYNALYTLIKENLESIKKAKPNVSKNSAGYYLWNVWDEERETFDLCRLIVGSQGTLGIVTEITFFLTPVKPKSKLLVVFLKDLSQLGKLVTIILPYQPESLESYDDNTLKIAVKFFYDFLKNKNFVGIIKFMFSFMPEFLMFLSGGIPKMILLIEFAGNSEEELAQQALRLQKELKKNFSLLTHITHTEEDEEKYWEVRHESFNLLRKHVGKKHTAPFIDDFIVRPEFLPDFLPRLNKILAEYPITYTIAGHPGDGNFHIIPLMDFNDPRTRSIILELSAKVYPLVLSYHGSITAEHNDGIIRSPYLPLMYGPEIYHLFEEVKKIFDPLVIFNPLKKVGTTKADITKYLIHGDVLS